MIIVTNCNTRALQFFNWSPYFSLWCWQQFFCFNGLKWYFARGL